MMRRCAAVAASAALLLPFLGAATAHASEAVPAEFVTVSGPVTVHDVSDDEQELWEGYAAVECPEGTLAVSGGVDLPTPWGVDASWADGRSWVVTTYDVEKSWVSGDLEEGDQIGRAHV